MIDSPAVPGEFNRKETRWLLNRGHRVAGVRLEQFLLRPLALIGDSKCRSSRRSRRFP
jgi:hypothetical protein